MPARPGVRKSICRQQNSQGPDRTARGGQTRPSCTGHRERFMPHCTTALHAGLVTHQKYCRKNAVFEEAGAEARICKKRDAIDDIGSPRLSGNPNWQSTRRAFLHFRERFVDPPDAMVIWWPVMWQAKLLGHSLRRRGGGKGSARCNKQNKTKHLAINSH